MNNLPNGWEWKTLGELSLDKGQYGSGARKVDFDGSVRYVRITDIEEDGTLKDTDMVSPSVIEEELFLKHNDLLFARSGSVGRTYLHNIQGGFKYQYAGYLIRFRLDPKVADAKYVFFVTKSKYYYRWVESLKRNVTISNINAKEYASLNIPLPPLPLQKQIVVILEQADKLKEKRQKANDDTNMIIPSIFSEMFNEEKVRGKLGDVAEIIMGQSPKGNTYNELREGMPLLNGPTEFGDRYPKEKQWTTNPTKKSRNGDILFCVRGATAGRLNWSDKEYCIGRGLASISTKGSVTNEYIYEFLKINYDHFQSIGQGSTFINIDRKMLANLQIPIPIKGKTEEFMQRANIINKIQEKQKKITTEVNNIFDALMQKAFTGELVS